MDKDNRNKPVSIGSTEFYQVNIYYMDKGQLHFNFIDGFEGKQAIIIIIAPNDMHPITLICNLELTHSVNYYCPKTNTVKTLGGVTPADVLEYLNDEITRDVFFDRIDSILNE